MQEAALPEGEELEALNTKLELIGESAEVYLFFTDCDGNVVLASDPDDLAGNVVEAVSYTHLDVYKRQELNMKNVKNKKMMAVVLPEGCFYGNCSDCVYACLLYTSQ